MHSSDVQEQNSVSTLQDSNTLAQSLSQEEILEQDVGAIEDILSQGSGKSLSAIQQKIIWAYGKQPDMLQQRLQNASQELVNCIIQLVDNEELNVQHLYQRRYGQDEESETVSFDQFVQHNPTYTYLKVWKHVLQDMGKWQESDEHRDQIQARRDSLAYFDSESLKEQGVDDVAVREEWEQAQQENEQALKEIRAEGSGELDALQDLVVREDKQREALQQESPVSGNVPEDVPDAANKPSVVFTQGSIQVPHVSQAPVFTQTEDEDVDSSSTGGSDVDFVTKDFEITNAVPLHSAFAAAEPGKMTRITFEQFPDLYPNLERGNFVAEQMQALAQRGPVMMLCVPDWGCSRCEEAKQRMEQMRHDCPGVSFVIMQTASHRSRVPGQDSQEEKRQHAELLSQQGNKVHRFLGVDRLPGFPKAAYISTSEDQLVIQQGDTNTVLDQIGQQGVHA